MEFLRMFRNAWILWLLQFSTILMPWAMVHAFLRETQERRWGCWSTCCQWGWLLGSRGGSRSAPAGFPCKDRAFHLFQLWANSPDLYFHLVKLALGKLFLLLFILSLRSSGSLSLIRSSQLFAGTATVASSFCSLSNPSQNPFSCSGKLTLFL